MKKLSHQIFSRPLVFATYRQIQLLKKQTNEGMLAAFLHNAQTFGSRIHKLAFISHGAVDSIYDG